MTRATFPLVPEDRDPLVRSGSASRSIARAAIATACNRINRSIPAIEFAQRQWPFDKEAQFILRAATAPTDMTSGAALVAIATAFLPLLKPQSCAARLFELGLNVTFGRDGVVMVPNISMLNIGFVGEAGPKAVPRGVSTAAKLLPYKLPGIVVVTSEMLLNPAIEVIMQRLLAESVAPALDQAVFSANAATAAQPAGIMNGIAPLTASTATTRYDALVDDLSKLAGAISPVAGGADIALIMNRAQSIATFIVTPRPFTQVDVNILSSNSVPAGTVIAVALNGIVSAMEVPTFESAMHVSLQMSDPAADLVSGGVVAAPQISTFQSDTVAIKMTTNVSWGVRSPTAVAWMSGVIW